MMSPKTVVIIGGGAAGFFAAIACAEKNPQQRVILFEKNRQLLSKVRISGGGRCNVTHHCFDPARLITNYPRGGKELRGPFSRFQPQDTIKWFESRQVPLKVEADGRMFPTTDNSETIINCLLHSAEKAGVEIIREKAITDVQKEEHGFRLDFANGEQLTCDCVLLAAGGASKANQWLEKLGHTIVPNVPSLFTFNIPDSPLHELSGISVPEATVSIENSNLRQTGPLLITHWGFSGPAVLKLSAWGARQFHERNYDTYIHINWLPSFTKETLKTHLDAWRLKNAAKQLAGDPPVALPKNLWKAFLAQALIPTDQRWATLSKQHTQTLIDNLIAGRFHVQGKSVNKDEFVTCGGVKLSEVDFKSMGSKLCPGLYFAGEILDIDGVTGGFNFQNAWTTGWIAGNAMAEILPG